MEPFCICPLPTDIIIFFNRMTHQKEARSKDFIQTFKNLFRGLKDIFWLKKTDNLMEKKSTLLENFFRKTSGDIMEKEREFRYSVGKLILQILGFCACASLFLSKSIEEQQLYMISFLLSVCIVQLCQLIDRKQWW